MVQTVVLGLEEPGAGETGTTTWELLGEAEADSLGAGAEPLPTGASLLGEAAGDETAGVETDTTGTELVGLGAGEEGAAEEGAAEELAPEPEPDPEQESAARVTSLHWLTASLSSV